MKKDAFYFPHDANAHMDHKMVLLRCDFGFAGIGMYWTVLEIMRNQREYMIDNYEKVLPMMLREDNQMVIDWITFCLTINLFDTCEDKLFSPSFLERMQIVDKKRKTLAANGKKGGRPSKAETKAKPNGLANENQMVKQNESKTKAIKEKKRKENKSKEESTNKKSTKKENTLARFAPPTFEDLAGHCKEKSFVFDPQAMLDFYASKDWRVGATKMKCWKSAASGWNRRELERSPGKQPFFGGITTATISEEEEARGKARFDQLFEGA